MRPCGFIATTGWGRRKPDSATADPGSTNSISEGSATLSRWKDIQADFLDPSGLPVTDNIGDGRVWTVTVNGGYRLTDDLRLKRALPGTTARSRVRPANSKRSSPHPARTRCASPTSPASSRAGPSTGTPISAQEGRCRPMHTRATSAARALESGLGSAGAGRISRFRPCPAAFR